MINKCSHILQIKTWKNILFLLNNLHENFHLWRRRLNIDSIIILSYFRVDAQNLKAST